MRKEKEKKKTDEKDKVSIAVLRSHFQTQSSWAT